ncbi:MAG: glycerol-3-phosphate 1-O-acyltransferase PlsY [Rickettsiales bacterium]|nr:glycerol-3-phosphate 1-O-acyltransferase PlsY [Rickettsiales bacterium]
MLSYNEYLFLAIAYLLGSVAFGVIITRLLGLGDITKKGSGNIGATNVVRVAGKKIGGIVFLLDFLKGLLPAFIYKSFLLSSETSVALYLIAFASVIGHILPIWHKFKGGKGVATGFGAILAIDYILFLIAILLWIITYKLSKISSASALVSYGLIPFIGFAMHQNNFFLISFLMSLSAIIFYKHIPNIKRLLNGEEKPFRKN